MMRAPLASDFHRRLALVALMALTTPLGGCATFLEGALDPVNITVENPPPHYTITITGDGQERNYDDLATLEVKLPRWSDYQVTLSSAGLPDTHASLTRRLNGWAVIDFALLLVGLGYLAQSPDARRMLVPSGYSASLPAPSNGLQTTSALYAVSAGGLGLLIDYVTGSAWAHTPSDLHLAPPSTEHK